MAQPVPAGQRLLTLDIARGIAILAIVFVNVVALSGPQLLMTDPNANGVPSTPDLLVFYGVRVFIAGKFISIFALLFGMGLALQTTRLEVQGRAAPVYLKRQGLLMVFGALHGVLLWWGDILFVYGVIGSAVFVIRNQKPLDLKRFAAVLIGVGALFQASALLSVAAIPTELLQDLGPLKDQLETAPDVPAWVLDLLETGDIFAAITALEIRIFGQGPFWASLLTRALLFGGQAFGGMLSFGLWVGGLMLLGVVFMRENFLEDDARQQWWIRWGIGVGLTVELLTNGLAAWGQFPLTSAMGAALEAAAWTVKPTMGVGIFALICQICQRTSVLGLFAPAGRLALTHYIGQSVVLNVLFIHWGFAWFGTMGRAQTGLICVAIVLGQLLFARIWLARFDRGPLEALWRRLTYGSG